MPDTCPYCGGPSIQLGQLSPATHYRCRNCGCVYAHQTEPTPTEEATCFACGGTAHTDGECNGKQSFRHWTRTEIRDHYCD